MVWHNPRRKCFLLWRVIMSEKYIQYPFTSPGMITDRVSSVLAEIISDTRVDTNDRSGGSFVCSITDSDRLGFVPYLTCLIGRIPVDKVLVYQMNALEKASRLGHLSYGDATSSFCARDRDLGTYGGAIYFPYGMLRMIFSFSGLPEHVDELLMVCSAHSLGFITSEQAEKYLAYSVNPHMDYLEDRFN